MGFVRPHLDVGDDAYYDIRTKQWMVKRAERKPAPPPVKTAKGCPQCGAPWEPTCSYCKAVNFSALCAKTDTPSRSVPVG